MWCIMLIDLQMLNHPCIPGIYLTWSRCAVLCLVAVMSNSLWPHGLQSVRLLCPWGFSRQEYWSGLPCPPPQDCPNPGNKARSPTLRTDSLPSEPPGKPKNTGVGSLPLLQGIFLTQGSNLGIPNWGQILYHLSHQGSPCKIRMILYLQHCVAKQFLAISEYFIFCPSTIPTPVYIFLFMDT